MVRVLNVAEKQSVAREITRHLSTLAPPRDRRVFNQAVADFPMANGVSMTVTAVRGHLMETDFENPALKNWALTDPSVLFSERIKRSVNNRDIANCLASLASQCDALVLWLDCDREGEAIGFEVIEVCQSANRILRVATPGETTIRAGGIYRAHFSALTHADLFRAWNTLGTPNVCLSQAVLARSEIDLRIGAAFTRFLTLRFKVAASSIISFGPCQFPTLGFVVARYLESSQFVSEPFWDLKLVLANQTSLLWDRTRLFDQLAVEAIRSLLADYCVVTEYTVQPKTHWRPLPLNTLELAKLASIHLRLPSHQCMQIAEALYHKGLVSYPRTETDKFHSSIDLRAFVGLHANHPVWGEYVSRMQFTQPRAGSRDDQAHPPIHPLKSCADLVGDELKVYELITRHFLACCSPDALGTMTHLQVLVPYNSQSVGEKFHIDGLTILAKNWLEVYPYAKWTGGASLVPQLTVGDRIRVQSLSIETGATTGPSLLSESELIDLMDKNGIGTDATMHEHIKTIQERHYCHKDPYFRFHPSELGIGLVLGFSAYTHLAKPTLRSAMETDLTRIANGLFSREQCVAKYIDQLRNIFHSLSDNPYYLDRFVRAIQPAQDLGTVPAGRGAGRGRGRAAYGRGTGRGRGAGRGGGRGAGRPARGAARGANGRNRVVRTIGAT